MLYPKKIKTQKLEIRKDNLWSLNDFQKSLGNIQWLHPFLRAPTGDLKPLSDILKEDSDPNSPRQLTKEGRQVLLQLENAIQHHEYVILTMQTHGKLMLFPQPKC